MSRTERAERTARYRVERLPPGRRDVLELLHYAAGRPVVHGLVELDVTDLVAGRAASHSPPSLTALVAAACGRAVRAHPEINVRRVGRRLIHFEDVALVVTVEEESSGGTLPVPRVVRHADARDALEITQELRRRPPPASGARSWLLALPPVVRRLLIGAAGRIPAAAAALGPPVAVSSLGMFGVGGWGIPLSPLTLMVTVGGIVARPALEDGRLIERRMLPLTLSFDHAAVDGAPAARFAATLADQLAPALLDR